MDMNELVKRVLDVDFAFEVTEVKSDGVLVRYDGKAAQVGGATKPALARAYKTLSEKYKAKDLEWLRNFKDVTLPALIRDYEELYILHDKYWHEESKTNGWEKLGNAYAAATDRLRYTAREIGKYLDGTIEALEAEIIDGEFTKHLGATRVMSSY